MTMMHDDCGENLVFNGRWMCPRCRRPVPASERTEVVRCTSCGDRERAGLVDAQGRCEGCSS